MTYVIEMLNITKEFPGIIANDDITLQIKKGEIHALLGENGAGKSTLMSVLFGLYRPEKGEIKINGQTVQILNPNDANRYGIGMVHQHFKLVHNFTVLENVILGVESIKNGFLEMEQAKQKVIELSQKYNLFIDPDRLISDITVGMQQRVEILKMLYRENDILIFDEPTAVLTPQEIEELMKIMKDLSDEGKTILFITHKLNEIKSVANRVSILRKGKKIDTVDVETSSKEQLSELMVGRKVQLEVNKVDAKPSEVVLELRNITVKGAQGHKNSVENVSFKARKGEILCIAGIEGNGQTDLVYAMTGLKKIDQGQLFFKGQDITQLNIRKRNLLGLGHIPEDRHKHGLVLDYNVAFNLILKSYFKPLFQKMGFTRFDQVNNNAAALIERFDIRSGKGSSSITRSMSGGNQQKVIIAREIAENPEVLIAVQPTRGLDVGAIEYIHSQLVAQRDEGKAVILVSLELSEVMNVSDRILVMYEGEIVGELDPKLSTTQELGLYMSGSKREKIQA